MEASLSEVSWKDVTEITGTVAAIIGSVGTVIAVVWAAFTYRKNSNLERAKWLERLYERFFCNDSLKIVRDLIDEEADSVALAKVEKMVKDEEPAFTDYLNFFEFVAILESRGQLHLEEVRDLFCYYLQNLKKRESISKYVEDPKNGFEKLNGLLDKM